MAGIFGGGAAPTGPFNLTDEDVDQNFAYFERYESLSDRDDLESLETASLESLPPVSSDSHKLVLEFEVAGPSGYEKRYKRPCWPGLSSGITIGIGYDIGYNTAKVFESDWKPLLPAQAFSLLVVTAGRKGTQAKSLLPGVKSIEIPWASALEVYQRTTVPKFSKLVMQTYPKADRLNPDCFGAIFSLVYNRGGSLTDRPGGLSRQHMRNIGKHIDSGNFHLIPKEFRDMKVLWGPSMRGLHRRRDAEAELFEKGLGKPAQVAASAPAAAAVAAATSATTAPSPSPASSAGLAASAHQATAAASAAAAAVISASSVQISQAAAAASSVPNVTVIPQTVPSAADDIAQPTESLANAEGDGNYWLDEYTELESSIDPDANLEQAAGPWAAVRWVESDDNSPDYKHILAADRSLAGCTFTFTPRDLELLISANSFEPLRDEGKLIFALRGAELQASTGAPDDKFAQINRNELKLKDCRPDHRNFRCTIGVYDIAGQKLSGFIASTVPNRNAVYAYSKTGKSGNILPPGCYRYVVGAHSKGRYKGCFRQDEPFAVLRSGKNPIYDTGDIWDAGLPMDNIHPAFADRTGSALFSSFGCQTIRGTSSGSGYTAEFAKFRTALGVTKPGEGDHGRKFSYVLLTGLEAAIAARLREQSKQSDFVAVLDSLGRLRQGSRGDRVTALQKALGRTENGQFSAADKKALAELQRSKLGWTDGIYSPAMDVELKFAVMRPEPVAVAALAEILNPPGHYFESASGAKSLSNEDRLFLELGRRVKAGESYPEMLGAQDFESLEIFDAQSRQQLIDFGKRAYARVELALHDLCCGDGDADNAQRQQISDAIQQASNWGPDRLTQELATLLLQFLFVIPPINQIVARIMVERIVLPMLADIKDMTQPLLTLACRRWANDLNQRHGQATISSLQTQPAAGAAPLPA